MKTVENKIKNITVKWIIETIAIGLIFYLATIAKIEGLAPFAIGLFMAFVLCETRVFVAAVACISTSIIVDSSYINILCHLCIAFSVLPYCLLQVKKNPTQPKKNGKLKTFAKIFIVFVALSTMVYRLSFLGVGTLSILVSVLFASGFCYIAYSAIRPILVNNMKYKFVDSEKICAGVVMLVLSVGLGSLDILGFSPIMTVVILAVCITNHVAGRGGLVVGLCMGAGHALLTYDITLLAAFGLVSLVMTAFISAPRVLTTVSGLLAYLLFRYHLNVDYSTVLYDIIMMGGGVIIYCAIPKRVLKFLKNIFMSGVSRSSTRHMINRNKQDISTSLTQAGEIFHQMSGILKEISSSGSQKSAVHSMADKLKSVCSNCSSQAACTAKADYNRAFVEICQKALEKGRPTMLDLPQIIVDDCRKMSNLIVQSEELATSYNKQVFVRRSEDVARGIVSDQLSGVGRVLESFASRIGTPVSYDLDKEKEVVQELAYHNIVCCDALISTESDTEACLVIRSEGYDKALVEKVLTKMLGNNMKCTSTDSTILSGWHIVYLSCANKYEVIFGSANCSKSKNMVSGDTHSFIKINHNKFMMALCDGMGSGQEAQKVSDTAISLVENFYKAGFDNETILSSINKFLALSCGEAFSAVDICVVDLDTGDCDIVKIGSPSSFVKLKETTLMVEGGALPLGVLEEMRPKVKSLRLDGGEMIVLASDGISDSFEGDSLATYINNFRSVNAQQLASKTLEKALVNIGNNPRDDMTVCVARVFKRSVS